MLLGLILGPGKRRFLLIFFYISRHCSISRTDHFLHSLTCSLGPVICDGHTCHVVPSRLFFVLQGLKNMGTVSFDLVRKPRLEIQILNENSLSGCHYTETDFE